MKNRYGFINWKVDLMLFMQHFGNNFISPFNYSFVFGTHYLKKIRKEHIKEKCKIHIIQKEKINFVWWKVNFMVTIQYFFNLFSAPLGYRFHFGINYLKNAYK